MKRQEVIDMSGMNMLLSDFSAVSRGNGGEVRELMEKIYHGYCKTQIAGRGDWAQSLKATCELDEKAGLRRKMRRGEVVSYGNW